MAKPIQDLIIVAGRTGQAFAKRIEERLMQRDEIKSCRKEVITPLLTKRFADGDIIPILGDGVHQKTVYVVQCFNVNETYNGINQHEDFMELLLINDALRRADADTIVNVIPRMPYGKQERIGKEREPISAKLVFRLLEASIYPARMGVITVDLHAGAAQGFTDSPVCNVNAVPLLLMPVLSHPDYLNKKMVVVSPDYGGLKRAREYAEHLDLPVAAFDKGHGQGERATMYNLLGKVKNLTTVILDDEISTGGTVEEAVINVKQHGAKDCIILCTHGVFAQRVDKQGTNSPRPTEQILSELGHPFYITDSVPRTDMYQNQAYRWLHTLSLSKYIADIILNIHQGNSIRTAVARHLERSKTEKSDINDYLLPVTPMEF